MTGTLLDHVLGFLIPFFLTGTDGDDAPARQAAIELLQSYGTTTDQQLVLAAEIVAFSLTTLANLGQSVADPDLSINTRLRLRSNANALSRASDRNRKALERTRNAEPAHGGAPEPASPRYPSAAPPAIDQSTGAIVEPAPAIAETHTSTGQPLSRQQRRFLARKAEQARAAQQRDARKAARLAQRATAAA
jgi:flagellum-specific peptidoglycan hydrolase FlgJ